MELLMFLISTSLVAVILAVFLKNGRMPVLAMLVSLSAGVIILVRLIPSLVELFGEIRSLAQSADLSIDYIVLILKAVCIADLGEFAAQICRDAGENGIAQKVELGVKLVMMLMALPLLKTILATVTELLV